MKLALIDYGVGNLHSAAKAFKLCADRLDLSLEINVGRDLESIAKADCLVLPGDGAFAECRQSLASIEGLEPLIHKRIIDNNVPFLGICVGMQLLATYGFEKEKTAGLNWISGDINRIDVSAPNQKVPHMGWNDIDVVSDHPLLKPWRMASSKPQAYFLHSYHFLCHNPDHILATTDHGGSLNAIVGRDNIIGVQFHPEKSQNFGLDFLTNFLLWSQNIKINS